MCVCVCINGRVAALISTCTLPQRQTCPQIRPQTTAAQPPVFDALINGRVAALISTCTLPQRQTCPQIRPQTTAAQPPVFDALDAVSLRTWVNSPYCSSLEGDVFKAANVLSKFTKVGDC